MSLGRQTTGTGTLIGTVSQPRPNDHARATRTHGARIFSTEHRLPPKTPLQQQTVGAWSSLDGSGHSCSAPDLRESPALALALGDVASSHVGHIARQHLDILRMRDGLNELEQRCASEPRRPPNAYTGFTVGGLASSGYRSLSCLGWAWSPPRPVGNTHDKYATMRVRIPRETQVYTGPSTAPLNERKYVGYCVDSPERTGIQRTPWALGILSCTNPWRVSRAVCVHCLEMRYEDGFEDGSHIHCA